MRVPRCTSGIIISRQVIDDPVDIRRRIDRLVARVDRRDDYGQLLVHDQLIHDLEDDEDVDAGARRSSARRVRRFARLARDGLSNPDIGARLFLSPRVVEWHPGKVFTKLGIGSRDR